MRLSAFLLILILPALAFGFNDFGSDGKNGFNAQQPRASSGSGAGGNPGFVDDKGFGGDGFNRGPGFDDKGFGGNQGFEGPNKDFGPMNRDFRGMGSFDLPPEAIEGMIFSEIGDELESSFGEEKLLAKCSNQPELVGLIIDEFQKTGLNLQTEICSDMEEGLSFCTDAKQQCEQIGNQDFGPKFGPEDDEENAFKPTCPPDVNQWKQACISRMKSELDRNYNERLEDEQLRCEERWNFDRPPEDACKNGKPRQPTECDKSEWISECLSRQPPEGDWGPGPENRENQQQYQQQNQQQYQQPYMPPNGQPPYGPPNGQQPPYGQGNQNQPNQNYQCPPGEEIERKKTECLNSGGRWEGGNDGKCPYIRCIFDNQNPPQQPPQQPSIVPQPSQQPAPSSPPQPTIEIPTIAPQPTQNPTAQPTTPPAPTQPPAEPTPQPTIQAAAMPFTGFITGRMTPAERCEQDWNRNSARFAQNCQRMQNQNKGPNFNFCNEQEFMSQCKQEIQKRMENEKQRMNPEKRCELEVKRDFRNFERYCKDTQKGKANCIKESERGCEFGKKQLERCKSLTSSENVKKAIENAVRRECKRRTGGGRDNGLGSKLRDSIPDNFKSLVDFEDDNVADAKEQANAIDKKSASYAITQLLGLQAEQERKDAIALKEQSERLAKTIERLKTLTEQVESTDAKAILEAQIADLEEQRNNMEGRAKGKEEGASGIFSILTNLFSGGK